MRESLTDTLRSTLAEAQSAARTLNQDFVGTEHLVVGLLSVDGEAARSLRSAHGTAGEIKSSLMASLPKGKQDPVITGDLPMSPKAQRAFNGAIVKAQSMRESKVSTRFLMLSLLDEMPPAARQAMANAGVDCDALPMQLAAKPEKGEA
jgi:ATP-dependent Clp protease ATP-binding subunit ClpC